MIKAGDIVKVKDWGKRYPKNDEWFSKHINDIKFKWMIKYAYEGHGEISVHPDYESAYYVLYVSDGKALITLYGTLEYQNVFLFSLDGLMEFNNTITTKKPVDMTIEEIENKLGHKVCIVSSKE